MEFGGFERRSGRPGIRNHVLVVSTVVCANVVAQAIHEALPLTTVIAHQCGCSMLASDLMRLRRALLGCSLHPNVGAVLAVGLGCEQVQAEEIAEGAAEAGRSSHALLIQEAGGESAAIAEGTRVAAGMVEQIHRERRRRFALSEILLGTECGGSDFTSGLAANQVLGFISDRLVEYGGAVILSETTEMMGAEHILAQRAVSGEVAARIRAIVQRVEVVSLSFGMDIRWSQPTPGNIRGGLTTIEEKSLGCIRKAGSSVLQGVVEYAERVTGRGLWIMDTPGQDVESVTGMASGGAQIIAFSTGLGTPVGCPIAPVIKVTANRHTATNMAEHIDFDATGAMEGKEDIDDLGRRLLDLLVKVASGELTRSERLCHLEFKVSSIGPTL